MEHRNAERSVAPKGRSEQVAGEEDKVPVLGSLGEWIHFHLLQDIVSWGSPRTPWDGMGWMDGRTGGGAWQTLVGPFGLEPRRNASSTVRYRARAFHEHGSRGALQRFHLVWESSSLLKRGGPAAAV